MCQVLVYLSVDRIKEEMMMVTVNLSVLKAGEQDLMVNVCQPAILVSVEIMAIARYYD